MCVASCFAACICLAGAATTDDEYVPEGAEEKAEDSEEGFQDPEEAKEGGYFEIEKVADVPLD